MKEISLRTVLGFSSLYPGMAVSAEIAVLLIAALAAFALRRRERPFGPGGFVLISLGLLADIVMHLLPPGSELTLSLEAAGLVLFFFGVIRLALDVVRQLVPRGAGASNIFRDLLMLVLYAVVVMVVLRATTRVDLTSLLATSAVLSVILGLGLQETLSNIFSGLTMQLQKPFEPGDWVRFQSFLGRVQGIGWRSTRLRTRTDETVEIPNNLLAKEVVINYQRGAVADELFIGLPYGEPPNRVKEVLMGVLRTAPGVLSHPTPEVQAIEYGDSAIRYRMRFWMKDYGIDEVARDLILSNVWYALRRQTIEVPFPIRTVYIHESQAEDEVRAEHERRLIAELRQVDFLEGLSDEDLAELLPNTRVHQFGTGEILMHEGEEGNCLHILRRGTVEVVARSASGGSIHIRDLKAPTFFGEIALMTGERRTASIIARTDVEVLELNRDAFTRMFRSRPETLEPVSEVVAARVSETRERVQNAPAHSQRQRDQSWLVSKMRAIFDL